MGLFDRFRSAGRQGTGDSMAGSGEAKNVFQLVEQGVGLEAEGRLEAALACYHRALEIEPGYVQARTRFDSTSKKLKQFGEHYNAGIAKQKSGYWKDAASHYRKAIQIWPEFALAHTNLGSVFHDLGQFDDAITSYRHALELMPDSAETYYNLGFVLQDAGRFDEAISNYRHALDLKPAYAEAYNNMGSILLKQWKLDEAGKCYRQALKINPDYPEASNNLGVVLREQGKIQEAMASFQRAIRINPVYAEAWNNLGTVQANLEQFEAAIASFQKAIAARPDYPEAYNNLGLAYRELGNYRDAISAYSQALQLDPDYAAVHNNLGIVHMDLARFEDAVACYRHAVDIKPGFVTAFSNLLFTMNYIPGHSASEYLEYAHRYGRLVTDLAGKRYSEWRCDMHPRRLRIGVVSGDLWGHPVGYFLQAILPVIDASRIELVAYSTGFRNDELTARIRPYFSGWKQLNGLTDEDAAAMIHADGIHVLLDLAGHTAGNRLPVFAWKPAPIQASWLGYFASTGVAEIDYLLADRAGVPDGRDQQYTESIWYLPDTRLCFSPPSTDLPVTALPCQTKAEVTFGCFQNLSKVNDEVLDTWGRILSAVPGARLYMQCKQLREASERERFMERLQRLGIPAGNISLHGSTSREVYLMAYAEVDLILDTFPYPGGTTTCEALWMGVPTLTLAGDTLLARQGASLLTAAGLQDWIAGDRDEYIARAISFAGDRDHLNLLRAGLRRQVQASPLFDAPRFARNFGEALWGMWQRWREGRPGA